MRTTHDPGGTVLQRMLRAGLLVHAVGCAGERAPESSTRPDAAVRAAVAEVRIDAPAPALPPSACLRLVACGETVESFLRALIDDCRARSGQEIHLECVGEDAAMHEVASGAADIAAACRHQVGLAAERDLHFHPVAWDSLAVVVHPDNPVDSISSRDLARLLSGRITNWEELGGFDEMVNVHLHADRDTGTARMARELLFADGGMQFSVRALPVAAGMPVALAVAKDPEGVGIGGVASARQHAVKIVAVDGVVPTVATMRSGGYPLMRPLYLVVHRDREARWGPFLRHARTEGQRAIALAGCVALADGEALWAPYRQRLREAHLRIGR